MPNSTRERPSTPTLREVGDPVELQAPVEPVESLEAFHLTGLGVDGGENRVILVLRDIAADGHHVENHSYNHSNLFCVKQLAAIQPRRRLR